MAHFEILKKLDLLIGHTNADVCHLVGKNRIGNLHFTRKHCVLETNLSA